MKKLLLSSFIILGIFSSSVFAVQINKVVKHRWDGPVHEKIIKTKKCWPHRGYCKIKKRVIYLNRDWGDKITIRHVDY